MNKFRVSLSLILVALLAGALVAPVAATSVNSGSINVAFNAVDAISIKSVTGSSSVNPTPAGLTNDSLTVTVLDSAGYAAVDNVTAQLTYGGVNYGAPVVSTASTQGGNSSTAIFTVSVPFQYYNPAGTYVVDLTASDSPGVVATSTYSVTYGSALGIAITSGQNLNFGSLNQSQTSAVQTSMIYNSANTQLSISAMASNFTSTAAPVAQSIPATSLTVDMTASQTVTNSGSGVTGTLAIGGTTAPVAQNIGFQETVPASVTGYSGTYSTTVTLVGTAS